MGVLAHMTLGLWNHETLEEYNFGTMGLLCHGHLGLWNIGTLGPIGFKAIEIWDHGDLRSFGKYDFGTRESWDHRSL